MARKPQQIAEGRPSRLEQLRELLVLWKAAEGDIHLDSEEIQRRWLKSIRTPRVHLRPPRDLSAFIEAMQEPDDETKAETSLILGKEFLTVAQRGNDRILKMFLEAGFPVNYQDPQTGQSALHLAAGARARDVVRLLLTYDDLNFLQRDDKGRLASEIAFLYGKDVAMARLLGIKERRQGERQRIQVTRRPRQNG